MPNVVTNRFLAELLAGQHNFNAIDIRAAFISSGTPTKTTNVFSELVAGLQGNRWPVTGLTITEDDTNHVAYVDADDLTTGIMAGPATVTWLVLYINIGTDVNNTVIGAVDIPDTVLNGSTLSIVWANPPFGMLRLLQGP